jgi:hypothetical protein
VGRVRIEHGTLTVEHKEDRPKLNEQELSQTLQELVGAWCDRRALKALKCLLGGYPLANRLTDGWANLMTALKDVRAFAREEITPEEAKRVNECIRVIERAVYRS